MKTFQQFLFIGVLLLGSPLLMYGQKASSALQFGVGTNALIGITNTRSLQTGWGTEFYCWLEQTRSERSSIRLTLAYRQQLGFQRKSITTEIQNQPSQIMILLRTKELAALEYLDARLNWQLRFSQKSPWAFAVGVRVAGLVNWQGKELYSVMSSLGLGRIRKNGTDWSSIVVHRTANNFDVYDRAYRLAADNFRKVDYGLELGLSYEFFTGLEAKGTFYQGFRNVFREKLFPDQGKYHVSNFSLGLAVRLF